MASEKLSSIIQILLEAVHNINTKRAYRRALLDFQTWFMVHGSGKLNKAAVQTYINELQDKGLGAMNINIRLIAIHKLAIELIDNGDLDPAIGAGILRVKGIRAEGRRIGNWMTKQQAQQLLKTPDGSTLRGKRDRAILAVLVATGIRREEAATLTFEHIQQRDGRWVIVDLVGKRNKVRSVPMPLWCKAAIDTWAEAAGIKDGMIFRSIPQGNRPIGKSMTPQTIYLVVLEYSKPLEIDLAPHDCRRTFAKLAHKGGSPIEQIQYSLGHANILITQNYLGTCQDLVDAPCDRLGLSLAGD
jgi:site-specific recombinase XerD